MELLGETVFGKVASQSTGATRLARTTKAPDILHMAEITRNVKGKIHNTSK
jgi:hypothetical protein